MGQESTKCIPCIFVDENITKPSATFNEKTKIEFKQEDSYLKNTAKQLKTLNSKQDLNELCGVFYGFMDKLDEFKLQFHENKWNMFVEFVQNEHNELLKLCHEDPLSKRSFEQPRGYAGDAVTLDMIYKQSFNFDDKNVAVTQLGRHVFEALIHNRGCEAVRERAQFIGKYIDALYNVKCVKLNALNVACGHLREVESCRQFWRGNINVIAMDQDVQSLNQIKLDYVDKGYNVLTIDGRIKKLLNPAAGLCADILKMNNDTKFDLIWSAGLYDYLNNKSAKLLTKQLFKMVKENGGRLLIGNCLNTMTAGYMECFMNWHLIYRDMNEIREFAADINPTQIEEIKEHKFECFAFIEITKQ